MALRPGALELARSVLGLKQVNDINSAGKITNFTTTKSPIVAAFDKFDKISSETESATIVPMKGSLASTSTVKKPPVPSTVRSRVLNMFSTTASKPKPKRKRAPKKPTKTRGLIDDSDDEGDAIDLDDSGEDDGEDYSSDENEDDIDEFDEDDPFFARDDEIDYESDASESGEDDDSDDSDVSTTREESSDEDDVEESSEGDIEEVDSETEDQCNNHTIARQNIRRWFQLLDCSTTDKIKDMIMGLIDSILFENKIRFYESTIAYPEAMMAACRLYEEGVAKPTAKASISACFLWLHARLRLVDLIIKNKAGEPLRDWLMCIATNDYADDTPLSATTRGKSQRCFYTDKPCDTGFTIIHCETKKPLATLWYCNDDEDVYEWVHTLVRFVFLPSYIRRWCKTSVITLTTTSDQTDIIEFAKESVGYFSQFLWSNGFSEAEHQSIAWPATIKKRREKKKIN